MFLRENGACKRNDFFCFFNNRDQVRITIQVCASKVKTHNQRYHGKVEEHQQILIIYYILSLLLWWLD